LVVELARHCDRAMRFGGSVTLRRRDVRRGLEPNGCFWIQNWRGLLGKTKLDLRVDPPSDLAIEIEIIRSGIPRLPIYAALGVPEVWRLDTAGLAFHVLSGSDYQEQSTSLAFPGLEPGHLAPFLSRVFTDDHNTIIRAFRAWTKDHFCRS
jgi:hypothetical protein